MIYLHETAHLKAECADDFVGEFQTSYLPHMQTLGARLVGLWETVPLVLPWPQRIWLWELDDLAAVGVIIRAQHGPARERFAEWQRASGRLCTGGEGRLLQPSKGTPTLAQLRASGVSLEMCVHEWIATTQNQGEDYCRQLEQRYAPAAAALNRVFVGTWHEVWNNREAINIWALPDPWTIFPNEIEVPGASGPPDNEAIQSWIVLSVGIREGFKSGLLHRLPVEG